MARKQAELFYQQNDEHKYIIISITDKDNANPTFNKNDTMSGVLKLKFDDVDDNNGITDSDVQKIIKFIIEHLYNTDLIVVHCEAGISRSSGVAAALSRWMNNDDMWVFENPRYLPNERCYKSILLKLGYTENQIDWDTRIKINEEKFKNQFQGGIIF